MHAGFWREGAGREEPSCVSEGGSVPTGLVKKKEEAGSETGRPPENEPNISLEETERGGRENEEQKKELIRK